MSEPLTAELPKLLDGFLQRLSPESLTSFDQATADLDPLTKHPDFLKHDRAEREQYVRDYLTTQVPELHDVFQGLAPASALGEHIVQQVLGPPTFQQTTGRTIYEAGKGVAAVGGAIAGAALTGGSPLGAGTLGAASYVGAESLLRQLTDLPEPSYIERAMDTVIEGSVQGLTQGSFNLATALGERAVGGAVKTSLLGKPFVLTPQEGQTFRILGEGSDLLGRAGTPAEGTMTPGQIMQNRGTPTGGTFIEEMMRNSFGGNIFSRRQSTRARQAGEAVLEKYTNTVGAMNDAREAAGALVEGYEARVQVAGQARREAYTAFGNLSASVPPQDTSTIVEPFLPVNRRPDIANLEAILKRDIPPDVASDVFGLLRTTQTGPLSVLPPGTVTGGMPVTVQGNPGIYVGPGTTPGTVMVNFPSLPTAQGPVGVLASQVEANVQTNNASYANIDLFSSIMGGIQRAGTHAAAQGRLGRGAGNADLVAAGRTAGWLKAQADAILQSTTVPLEVREGRELVRRIYREENDAFYTPLVQGMVARFRQYPDTFARELSHPDNADVLAAVHKAVEAMPSFNAGTITDPVQRAVALSQNSQYLTGTAYWNTRIRPYIQVNVIRRHLAPPGSGASGGLTQFETAVEAPTGAMNNPDFVQAGLFSINAPGMLRQLDAMTPATRLAVFGSEPAFQQLYQIATALRQSQAQVGSTGSMLMPLRQIAGATILTGAAGGIIAGQATGDPYITGLAALGSMTLPIALARTMTDPAFVRRLVFGIRNPRTGQAQRVFGELGKDMIRLATEFGIAQPSARSLTVSPLPDIPAE